jgi:phosphate transport system permease protein
MSETAFAPPAPGPFSAERGSLFAPDARYRYRRLAGQAMALVVGLAALAAVVVLWIILIYVFQRGWAALSVAFFTERPLPYGEPGGGIGPALLGSLLILLVAALVGVPIGLLTGIYLSEYGRGRFAEIVRFSSDLVAGMPSIVVGVFVWALLVREVIGHFSGVAGAAALAIIMIPIIVRTVDAILRLVPHSLREAALALGVPRRRVVLSVVLPSARAGIITGIVLALARAAGETAPLLLTTLGNQFFNWNLWQPTAALPVQIYNYAVAPYEDWHTKAWGASLVLVVVIGCLSVLTRFVTRGKKAAR